MKIFIYILTNLFFPFPAGLMEITPKQVRLIHAKNRNNIYFKFVKSIIGGFFLKYLSNSKAAESNRTGTSHTNGKRKRSSLWGTIEWIIRKGIAHQR
jgi:hypothetical protein